MKRNVILRSGTSDVWCLQNVFLDHEYETPFPIDPKVIIDAGANIGMVTLFFAQKYPQARVVSIEPEPSNFTILRKNCSDLPRVDAIRAALWPTDKALVIKNPASEKWGFEVGEAKDATDLESVKAVTIPGILQRLQVKHIDILKLDIEGAERELFSGEVESWLGSVGQIIIELHDKHVPGCSSAFYGKIIRYPFSQATKADNIFINLRPPA